MLRRPRGLMDKASPSGGEDWGFESPRGRFFFIYLKFLFFLFFLFAALFTHYGRQQVEVSS